MYQADGRRGRTRVPRGVADAGARYGGDDSGSGTPLADGRSAECNDQDSGNAGRSAGDHALYRGGRERQRHPALLGRALRRGHRRVPRRYGPQTQSESPTPADRVGGELLRESSRWQGRSAARRSRRPQVAPRQDRHRQCLLRIPALRVVARYTAMGPPGQGGGQAAAPTLGFDQHQGSALLGCPLRRAAHRSPHGQYAAAGDVRRVSGPWSAGRPHHRKAWPSRRVCSRRWRSAAWISLPSPRELEDDGVAKFAASYASLLAGIEAKAGALAGR